MPSTSNVLPASYAAAQAAELALLDELRTSSVASTPYIRGKTSLNDLLGRQREPGGADRIHQRYAASGGKLGPTWKALRANSSAARGRPGHRSTRRSAG